MKTQAESELKITVAQIERNMAKYSVLLDEKYNEYKNLIETRAQKKAEYKTAKYQKLLTLGNEPVTTKNIAIDGDKNVARLEMQYEIALGIERACFESWKDTREKLATLRSLLSYHKAENFMGGS